MVECQWQYGILMSTKLNIVFAFHLKEEKEKEKELHLCIVFEFVCLSNVVLLFNFIDLFCNQMT